MSSAETGNDWIPETYNDEYRHLNKSVIKLKELLKTETDPLERIALEFALNTKKTGCAFGHGEPYRGERKEVRYVNNLRELISDKRVTHVFSTQLQYGSVPELIDVDFLESDDTCLDDW